MDRPEEARTSVLTVGRNARAGGRGEGRGGLADTDLEVAQGVARFGADLTVGVALKKPRCTSSAAARDARRG